MTIEKVSSQETIYHMNGYLLLKKLIPKLGPLGNNKFVLNVNNLDDNIIARISSSVQKGANQETVSHLRVRFGYDEIIKIINIEYNKNYHYYKHICYIIQDFNINNLKIIVNERKLTWLQKIYYQII